MLQSKVVLLPQFNQETNKEETAQYIPAMATRDWKRGQGAKQNCKRSFPV